MSRSPVVLSMALLSAVLLSSAASAQSANPLAGADCREAKLDRVIRGRVSSTEVVIICKRTDQLKALLAKDGVKIGAARAAQDKREVDSLAFTGAGGDRECAMLNCPSYILTGVGD